MKKLILLAAFMVIAFQGFSQTSLEPTKLGEWNRPAATGIADVDQYIDACADMYQEAMDIRKQYEAIDTLTLNVGEALEIAQNNDETINHKIAEYKALFERVEAQQQAAATLPALAEKAAKSVPLGLKAIAITKAIASTKNAIKLAVEENVALVKAITQQLSTLSMAPVKGE